MEVCVPGAAISGDAMASDGITRHACLVGQAFQDWL